jgi:hypothetical protein
LEENEANRQIDKVIQFAMGALDNWRRPIALKSVGPAFPEAFDRFEEDLAALRHDLRVALATWSKVEDICSAYPLSEAFNPLFDSHGRHASLAKRLVKAKSDMPQDFVGGWSVEGKEVERAYWRGIPAFTSIEASLLSVGRDPRHINFESIFMSYGRSEEADELLYFLEDRQEQIARAFGLDPEDEVSTIPAAAFLCWANESKLMIDSRFRRMLRDRWPNAANVAAVQPVAADPNDSIPHGTSRKAYARLVTAIAIQRYGLKQEKEIGRIAKQMCGDSELVGLGVQAKPIRDLLRVGWSLLPSKDRPS